MTKIRRWRERIGLSQKRLAEILGVSQQTVSDIERGEQNLTSPMVTKLLAHFPQAIPSEDWGVTLIPSFDVRTHAAKVPDKKTVG